MSRITTATHTAAWKERPMASDGWQPAMLRQRTHDRLQADRLNRSIREWNALPWYRRLWYWVFGAPEVDA
jgi:hypothetical protein